MAAIWSPENRYRKWLDVELLACEAWAERGEIPRRDEDIRERAAFDVDRIDEIEKTTKHDVIAFLTSVTEHVGEDGRFIHMGMTSSDVLDTALAVQMQEAADLLLEDMDALLAVLKEKALEHRRTLMIGRSHGIHAEPITFGLKLALWHAEMRRNRERLVRARKAISAGKLSGAVGTFSFIDPAIEAHVLGKLGLEAEPVASQIVQRDRHAEYFATLATRPPRSTVRPGGPVASADRGAGGEEYFSPAASSAMPHKRSGAVRELGLARLMRSMRSPRRGHSSGTNATSAILPWNASWPPPPSCSISCSAVSPA